MRGGTQIEAHLLNALARGRQHRRAVVVVVFVVLSPVSSGTTVAALTPLASHTSAARHLARTHLHPVPVAPVGLDGWMRVSVGLRIIFGIIITMSPCFAWLPFVLSPFVVSSCCPAALWQFFCPSSSSSSSHLLLAVFGTFPCGLQREIRFSYGPHSHSQSQSHSHTCTQYQAQGTDRTHRESSSGPLL